MAHGRAGLLICGMLLGWAATAGAQQGAGNTTLVLQVLPESRLDQQQIALAFHVSADGSSDVAQQTAPVTAWVRPMPNQQIHVTASLQNLSGPGGPVAATAVQWSGAVTQRSGAGAAGCTQGRFPSGSPQDLVSGWQNPGKLTCSVQFSLADPRSLAPGDYTGTVNLAVAVQ